MRSKYNPKFMILSLPKKEFLSIPDVDLRLIAGRTSGFVGADLANIVNEAALLAARKNKEKIEAADFDEAIGTSFSLKF
jgi:cell division protease FtsH